MNKCKICGARLKDDLELVKHFLHDSNVQHQIALDKMGAKSAMVDWEHELEDRILRSRVVNSLTELESFYIEEGE